MDLKALYTSARKVLETNSLDGFTKPAPILYPYQWNWDSGFIAMAYAHYDMSRAQQELQSLFKGQWKNGLLPQIVFHKKSDAYFPGPDFWQCGKSTQAPKSIDTSGITMPAVHGFVLRHMLKQSKDLDSARRFLKTILPSVIDLHRYLYTWRDPQNEGLPYIRHPWEGGTDNSPFYDHVFRRIELSESDIPSYVRKDLKSTEARKHRPLRKDYDLYVYLVDLFRKNNYDEESIDRSCPFKIQDPLFIGILNYSNEALIEICDFLNTDKGQLEEWFQATEHGLGKKLLSNECLFQAFDLVEDKPIEVRTNSCLVPWLCQSMSTGEKKRLEESYRKHFIKEGSYACPTTAYTEPCFENDRYWRGPVWLNLNYLLLLAFERHGLEGFSTQLQEDSLDLVHNFGFFEYFDSDKNETENGYGTDNFSWSAALSIILIEKYKSLNTEF